MFVSVPDSCYFNVMFKLHPFNPDGTNGHPEANN